MDDGAVRVLYADAEKAVRERVVTTAGGPTVDDVASAEAALDRLDDVDCLVVADDLEDGDPLDLVEAARERHPDLPIVLYPREASHDLASAASASATRYLPNRGPESDPELLERVREAIEATERRAELERKGEILDALQDHLDVSVYVKDAKGRYRWLSDVEGGYNPEYAKGRTDLEVIQDDRLARQAYEDDMRVIETGEPVVDREERMVGEDYELWLETTKVPWIEDGEVRGLVGVTRQINEKKELEQDLEKQTERLERFASYISHDLRNPLNVARGYLDLARVADDPDEETFEEIEAGLTRIEEIIDDVVAMVREEGITTFANQPRIEEVAREAWATVESGNATLEVDVPEGAMIHAGGSQLQQLFENLFRNAVEHGAPEGRTGDLTVRVGLLEEGFYVADDGVGIPDEEREEVVEYGYTTGEGSGTGLAIVSEITELYGWTIDVEESESGGARFEIGNCLLVAHPDKRVESGEEVEIEDSVDVGDPLPGSTEHEGRTWTLEGAGEDVWGEMEGLHYAYATVEGDARITARVTGLDAVHEYSKAGVMLRGGIETGEPLAHTGMTGEHGSEVIWRPEPDEPIWSKFPNDEADPPYWYRVDRVGGFVTSSVSPNGQEWYPVDQRDLGLDGPVTLGLVVCSHEPDTLTTGTFDDVSILVSEE